MIFEGTETADTRQKILIVDDSAENLVALEAVLESLGQEIVKANSGLEALRQCLDHDFAAILLDVKMPEMDGFETASLIRSRRRSQHTPILFLTGFRNEEHLFRGYDLGAVDFLFKPIVSEVLQSKVAVFVELSRNAALLRAQAAEIRNLNAGLERKIRERTAELIRDIAERERAEEALRESEQRLRVAIEAANLGIWSIDTDTLELTASARMNETFGFQQETGHTLDQLLAKVTEDDRARVDQHLRRALTGEAEFHCEFGVNRGNSRRWVACHGSLFNNSGSESPRLVGVSQDVTDRRVAEDIVRHKQKLESLGVLAGGIAHDFNNLLTGVMGHASLVHADPMLTAANRECLENVLLAAESAAQLTRQMLAYSGRGRFVVQALDLSGQVREVQPLLQAAVPKTVQVEFDLRAGLPDVEIDTAQFHQLVLNLVQNAGEAVVRPSGGFVRISTRLGHLSEEDLSRVFVGRELPSGVYIALEVRDNGEGMDEETQSKIFDPFFTTKFTGRGLGLAAAMGIVQGHRGAIHLESQPGKGTTFTIFFPPTAKVREQILPAPAPARQAPGSGQVLVADDEEVIRATAKACLERNGFTVVLARDGQECVEMVRHAPERFDIILLDMAMPVMDGGEAFRSLLSINPNIPVVASSGYDEAETVARFGEGLAGFIKKPYTANQLVSKIKGIKSRGARALDAERVLGISAGLANTR
jgi:two-component system, cell cycle sensor histidine kinase and response regulator CckA